MSFHTQADTYRDEALDAVSIAIGKLTRIVVDQCEGHDEYNDEYRAELCKAFAELLDIRRRLQ